MDYAENVIPLLLLFMGRCLATADCCDSPNLAFSEYAMMRVCVYACAIEVIDVNSQIVLLLETPAGSSYINLTY